MSTRFENFLKKAPKPVDQQNTPVQKPAGVDGPPPPFQNKLIWWCMFMLATWSLSRWLHTFRVFSVDPDVASALAFTAATLLLVVSFGALLFDGYIKEKRKGSLGNTFFLFEWLDRWLLSRRRRLIEEDA